MILHLFLFTLTCCAALLLGVATKVFGLWTGAMPTFPTLVPALAVGFAAAWACGKWLPTRVGSKVCAGLSLAAAIVAFTIFGDTDALVRQWTLLSMRIGLTYDHWHAFVVKQAWLWLAPLAVLIPFVWSRNRVPHGRLTAFCGACVGLIAARCLAGRVTTVLLLDIALAGMLLAAPLWWVAECRTRWAKGGLFALTLILLVGWYYGSRHTAYELIGSVNPFATIAARDTSYLGTGSSGVALREGRVVRTVGQDEAAMLAAELVPALLKPAPNARIAARLQAGSPQVTTYETTTLKGLYDALLVELPPAWMAEEADYFKSAALESALTHLNDAGVLVYAMDARALDGRMVMERLGILRERLPHVQLWMTGVNQWQLVASRQPITTELSAITALMDRPDVAAALTRVRVAAPIFLLPSCITADFAAAEAALRDPIEPRIPAREHRHARTLLFDGQGGRRLLADFAQIYEAEMAWVTVSDETASEMRQILQTLRAARRKAMLGDFADAARNNPYDPFLLGLADRELRAGRDAEKLAEHEQALTFYGRAFALAQPSLEALLEAATIAQATGKADRAEPFYELAREIAPNDPSYLVQHATFLFRAARYAEAEALVKQVVARATTAQEIASARFFEARCIAHQAAREAEGLALARLIATTVQSQEDKDRYIPAYGQLLIDVGKLVEGLKVKQHYQAYNELLPPAPPPPPATPAPAAKEAK